MEITISFGYWIHRQRKALDLTQQVLADKVGCSLAAIKKIEGDERRPSRQIAERLADILGVPASQIPVPEIIEKHLLHRTDLACLNSGAFQSGTFLPVCVSRLCRSSLVDYNLPNVRQLEQRLAADLSQPLTAH